MHLDICWYSVEYVDKISWKIIKFWGEDIGLFGFGKNKKKDDIEKEVIKEENTNISNEKVSIKVLGEGCEKCDKVNDNLKEAVEILNLDADIEKIEDLIEIVTYGVMSTPGIVINEKVVSVGKVLKTDEIVELLKKNI